MKHLGFKQTLLLSILLLTTLSVGTVSYFFYQQSRDSLTAEIDSSTRMYLHQRAIELQNYLNDKVQAVANLGRLYSKQDISGDFTQLTHRYAAAVNTQSFVIGLDSGKGYWNQTSDNWPNHVFKGDVRSQSWYQLAMQNSGVAVTDPYGDNPKWMSIVHKIKNGMIAADFELTFFNELVNTSDDIEGSMALIISQDSTILATSSPAMKLDTKLRSYSGFGSLLAESVNYKEYKVDYHIDGKDKVLYSKQFSIGGKNWYYLISLDKKVVFGQLEKMKSNAMLLTAGFTLLSVIAAFFIIQFLFRPVVALRDTIQELSKGNGDLTQRLEVNSKDELGQIAGGVNGFISHLQQLMLEIEAATIKLEQDVTALTGQTQSNAEILNQHVVETEQIVAAIEEMNSTAETVAHHAAETAQFTSEAATMGGESLQVVGDAQSKVTSLQSEVETTANSLHQMSEETKGISSILNVIGEIAEQTNLLALNAAIEAARAGEQGRGFAVVADEVRALASRTQTSTGEIEHALDSLLAGSKSVTDSMDITKETCDQTFKSTETVGERIDGLTNHVAEINDLSTQIATAAEEQSSVTQEVSRNMSSINEMVSQLHVNGQETQTQTESIAVINNQISSLVGKFRLK
ncbi:methyl-accepting chemotaxis protein [Vibrio sp. SCSIO 43137]|uniref:methyl-accepting chemotaxis protein n=1 Tax=Vibrio sp. SCSIO 43137 TaxID=3021011 RepID=UPI002306F8DE|nr:methyl-accepting chemotaxis protein [Vibrio sp. SCSIO 43137]WCE30333.1 methyl-accepting chemotaxis protein [Vibrio sp. SCSIO 43137]